MINTCIIVADGGRARFFTLDEAIDVAIDGGPRLVEHHDFVNPDGDLPARWLFSDRSGRGHSSSNGGAHGLDDHRDQHLAEFERRFARRVIEHGARFVAAQNARRLILVAGSRFLGRLRGEMAAAKLNGVRTVEVGENLSRRSPEDVHRALASRGLCPEARPPEGATYHPRAQPLPQR